MLILTVSLAAFHLLSLVRMALATTEFLKRGNMPPQARLRRGGWAFEFFQLQQGKKYVTLDNPTAAVAAQESRTRKEY